MRYRRCKICGAIIYDEFNESGVCDICEDEREESNDNGTGEVIREQDKTVSKR